MGKKQYHTRLDDDTAQWVDEFREERDITQAEAVRRLVRAGQQEYQRDDSDDGDELEESDEETEQTVMADGSGVTESVLEETASVLGALTLVPSTAYTLWFLGLVEFPVLSLDQLHTASMSAFFAFLLCYGLLYTSLPERVDRALYTRARSVRNVVSPGGE